MRAGRRGSLRQAVHASRAGILRFVAVAPAATRARFLSASLVPAAFGAALARWRAGRGDPLKLLATLVGVGLLHMGCNMLNDAGDAVRGADAWSGPPRPFSGGSRLIQDGVLSLRATLWWAAALLAGGCGVGLWLDAVTPGHAVLPAGMAGALLGVCYSLGPRPLGYTPAGVAVVGLVFGPLVTLGAYVVQAQRVQWTVALSSAPLGFLIAYVLLVNQIPDRSSDAAAGKRTAAVVLGVRRAADVGGALVLLAYAAVCICVAAGLLPRGALASAAALPLAVYAWRASRRGGTSAAGAAAIALHGIVGMILLASVLTAARGAGG